MVSLYRVFKLIIKELHWLKSDKRALFMALLLPPLIMAAFSSMALLSGTTSVQGSSINLAIVNYDDLVFDYTYPNGTTVPLTQNSWAQVFIGDLQNSSLTEIRYSYNISEDTYGMLYARQHLANKRIDAILSIPAEFSEAIEFGFPAILEALLDGSSIMALRTVMNTLQIVVTEFQQSNNITPYFKIENYVEFTTGDGNDVLGLMSSLSVPFLIIGATLILTLLVIVKEAPLSRLLMTPAKKSEILLSKYLTYSAIMTFQIFLIFLVNTLIGLQVAGPLLDFFIAMLLVGFYGVTMGLFISTISGTEIQANQYFLGIFLISVLVSGMFVPIENMALWLQILAYIFPLASAVPLLSNISLKGFSLMQGSNLIYFGTLLGVSLILIGITVIVFSRKKLEV